MTCITEIWSCQLDTEISWLISQGKIIRSINGDGEEGYRLDRETVRLLESLNDELRKQEHISPLAVSAWDCCCNNRNRSVKGVLEVIKNC